MRYNNGSEAAMQWSLNWLFQSLNSGQITWHQKLSVSRLSVGELHGVSSSPELGQECDGCDSGHWENLCNLCVSSDQTLIWSVETLVINVRFIWKEASSKCAGQLVCFWAGSHVLETSLFLICAFLSTCEFSTCRAPSVLHVSSPVEGPRIHWMSVHRLILTSIISSVWTLLLRWRHMTTS